MRKNQSGIAHLLLIVIVVAVAAVLVGGGVYVAKANKDKTASREIKKSEVSLATPLPDNLLTVEKVKDLVTAETPNVNLTGVELDLEHGVYLYKVKLANGSVLYFNAQTGAKVTRDTDKTKTETASDDEAIPANFAPGISYDKAREVALTKVPNGVIRKIELTSQEGRVVYSVRFRDGARVDVDATTGTIVSTKPAKTRSSSSSTSATTATSDSGSNDANSSDDD